MVYKERCVCEICSCGKHHCGPDHKFKSVGTLDLKSQGDIYVATKASFEFPDSLTLFEGSHDHTTTVKDDYKVHSNVGVHRAKPTDEIQLGKGKMEGLTVSCRDYPEYDMTPRVSASDVKQIQAAPLASADVTAVKMKTKTSYEDHYPGKSLAFEKSVQKVRGQEQCETSVGELDLATINKTDYVPFSYGRPHLSKIADSNLFGLTAEDRISKTTTSKEHFPGFKSAPAQKIKAEENGIVFGTDDNVKTSMYGDDFKRTQPKVRESKRRGTAVDFGVNFDHVTSYNTQFEGKSGGKVKAASFDDQLALFSGDQDLETIAKADYKGHSNVGVQKHRPKDQIEIPSDKMTMDTITLGHYQPPTITKGTVSDAHAASDPAKSLDITSAMPNVKMESETSYKQQFAKKKSERVGKFDFKDEISASVGDLDLTTTHKSDYAKFDYGRPQINKIKDSNIMGRSGALTMDVEDVDANGLDGLTVSRGSVGSVEGAVDIAVESVPHSRESGVRIRAGVVKHKTAVPDKGKSGDTSYGEQFKPTDGKIRSSKKKDATVNFGRNFYEETSYNSQFKSKQCLVPSLDQLDDYTFRDVEGGHKFYKIKCGCPPKGSCGCPVPPAK